MTDEQKVDASPVYARKRRNNVAMPILFSTGYSTVIPNVKKPVTKEETSHMTLIQKSIEKKLEGLPGDLDMNEKETKTYFGKDSRKDFFQRYKWLDRQLQITKSYNEEEAPALYFDTAIDEDDDFEKAEVAAQEEAIACKRERDAYGHIISSPHDKTSLDTKQTVVRTGEFAFAPRRPHFVEDDDSQSDESIEEEPVFGQLYPKFYMSKQELSDDLLACEERERARAQAALEERTLESGITTKMNTLDLAYDVRDDLGCDSDNDDITTASALNHSASGSRQGNCVEGISVSQSVPKLGSLLNSSVDYNTRRPNSASVVRSRFGCSTFKSKLRPSSASLTRLPKANPNLAPHHYDRPADEVLDSLAIPNSPRTNYLVGCAKNNILPRPSLVLRKMFTKELNLKHQGMGDANAIILAESLKTLPYIQSIDISDNNLTCDGLCAVFEAIASIPDLLSLDIAQNDIGPDSAGALGRYLSNPNCPLIKLGLRHSDVDDYECGRFVGSLAANKSIKEVDLAHNKLGQLEVLNISRPEFESAGETIASLLEEPSCIIESLDLSWNMIRAEGGVALCNSLTHNRHLTYLDLSYNGLGNDGGIALGDGIVVNTALRYLKLASNNIDESAAVTIVQGAILNTGLKELLLDGNPIGEQGSKSMLAVPLSGTSLNISLKNCNIEVKDDKCVYRSPPVHVPAVAAAASAASGTSVNTGPVVVKPRRFDLAQPIGTYELHLDNPFERAMALSLLDIVVRHQTFVFNKVCYYAKGTGGSHNGGVKGKKGGGAGHGGHGPCELIELVAVTHSHKEKNLDGLEMTEISHLKDYIDVLSDKEHCLEIFNEICNDKDAEELEREGFLDVFHELGLREMTLDQVDEIIKDYDLDGDKSIGLDEFVLYLDKEINATKLKMVDLLKSHMFVTKAQASNPNAVKYIPPKTGVLILDVIDGMKCKPEYKFISKWEAKKLYDIASSTDDIAGTISTGIKLLKLRVPEALYLFRFMDKAKTMVKVKLIALLLPTLDNPTDVRKFMSITTEDDRFEIQQVKDIVGLRMRIMLGLYDGYYHLDLKVETDRTILYRLVELSRNINTERKANCPISCRLIGDTSQHGNWTCFRNELLSKKPIEITPEKFTPSPLSGILEFDFVSGEHPPLTQEPMLDRRFLNMLTNCCLLRRDQHKDKMVQLSYLKAINDASLDGDGMCTAHVMSEERCTNWFLAKERFHENQHIRGLAFSQKKILEEVKHDYLSDAKPVVVQRRETAAAAQIQKQKLGIKKKLPIGRVRVINNPGLTPPGSNDNSPATSPRRRLESDASSGGEGVAPSMSSKSLSGSLTNKKSSGKKKGSKSSAVVLKPVKKKEKELGPNGRKIHLSEEEKKALCTYVFEEDDPMLVHGYVHHVPLASEFADSDEYLLAKKTARNNLRTRNFKKLL